MKARPKTPSARKPAAKKPAVTGKRAAVARQAKAKVTARTSKAGRNAKAATRARAPLKPAVTTLAADCTIEHAPDLQQQLAKVLDERACVTLDFSAVKRCDTAGMQVLAAFIRERREAGRDLALANLSEAFLATAKLLGLSALFENAKVSA